MQNPISVPLLSIYNFASTQKYTLTWYHIKSIPSWTSQNDEYEADDNDNDDNDANYYNDYNDYNDDNDDTDNDFYSGMVSTMMTIMMIYFQVWFLRPGGKASGSQLLRRPTEGDQIICFHFHFFNFDFHLKKKLSGWLTEVDQTICFHFLLFLC